MGDHPFRHRLCQPQIDGYVLVHKLFEHTVLVHKRIRRQNLAACVNQNIDTVISVDSCGHQVIDRQLFLQVPVVGHCLARTILQRIDLGYQAFFIPVSQHDVCFQFHKPTRDCQTDTVGSARNDDGFSRY